MAFWIGKELRELRIRRGLSLTSLAALAGVGKATLSYWENGKRSPSVVELDAVLNALGVDETRRPEFYLAIGAPRGMRKLREVIEDPTPLTAGAVLRAMRLRRRWSLSQLAASLEVQSSTVSRWERGESWPPIEVLTRACRQLGASANEIEALLRRDAGPLEVPEDYFALVEAMGRATGADDELKLLSLEGALLLPARSSDKAREMLGLVLSARAKWLSLWDRSEAVLVAEAALSLVKPSKHNVPTWLWPIHILAKDAAQGRSPRLGSAIDRIQSYEPLLSHSPEARSWYRRLKAEYVAKTGAVEEGLRMNEEAMVMLSGCSTSNWYTAFDRANMLLEAGRATEALDLIYPTESQHPAIVGRHRLTRGKALLVVGQYGEAEQSLQEALAISLENALPRLATSTKHVLQNAKLAT